MDEKKQNVVRGPIVEDETVVGGVDAQTGAAVVRPKGPDGKVDESVKATDPRRERHGLTTFPLKK